MIVWCRNLTILLLGLAFHCFLLQKIENRYATALAGHRAAILFNLNLVVRLMKIIEVKEDKKQYLDLLLLADEQENMIDRYIDKGKMYVLDDNGVKCECIITDEGNDVLEIKNIATVPDYQGKGYAKSLIDFIVEKYREQYAILQVGTGDSPLTIPFYEKCGFVRSHIIPNFFTDNYDHPIYEDGVQLVDMVYLQRSLSW